MRKYEIMYILDNKPGSEGEANLKSFQDKLHKILEGKNGKIIEKNDWGVKNFAYPIKTKKSGYYTVLIVETDAEAINEFQRVSKIESTVIRTLVINTEKEKGYIQSTEYAKTFIPPKESFERKTAGKRFDRKNRNRPDFKKEDVIPTNTTTEKVETPSESK